MEYRSLGRTGVQVSSLCLGTLMFGKKTGEEEAVKMVLRALEAGVNFIDTANAYNRGRSEEYVGKALKESGRRDTIVLATKVHNHMGRDINAYGNSRRHILQQCDASLRRLQTDCIDLYQIHRPMPEIPIDETLRALDDLVRAGKVRYLGTSSFAAWQIVESLWASKEYGLNRFICEQPPYSLLDRRIERDLVPMAQTYGIGIIPWAPLASGFLTGKYKPGEPVPEEFRLHKGGRHGVFSEEAYAVVQCLKKIAREKSCTVSQLALAWCMRQPGVTSPIIGPKSVEQLEDNLGAADVTVTAEDRKALDQVAPPEAFIANYYNAEWYPPTYRW